LTLKREAFDLKDLLVIFVKEWSLSFFNALLGEGLAPLGLRIYNCPSYEALNRDVFPDLSVCFSSRYFEYLS